MINGQRVLAVVIGRAGSKGLPGKNVLPLPVINDSRPTICYSVKHAQDAQTIDSVIVSTDGERIARAVAEMNVKVVLRPKELASDTATVDAAVRHAVTVLGDPATIIVILYANVPIRPTDLIDRAIQMLVDTGADSVQSYCDVGKYHPFWMVNIDESHRVNAYVSNTVYRRQDLPTLYVPDGGVIAVRRDILFHVDPAQPHAFLGIDRRAIINAHGDVIDIDTLFDSIVAAAKILHGQGVKEVSIATR
jgi:CMP-N,N'-diacetyllegionaminic acid synthase